MPPPAALPARHRPGGRRNGYLYRYDTIISAAPLFAISGGFHGWIPAPYLHY